MKQNVKHKKRENVLTGKIKITTEQTAESKSNDKATKFLKKTPVNKQCWKQVFVCEIEDTTELGQSCSGQFNDNEFGQTISLFINDKCRLM